MKQTLKEVENELRISRLFWKDAIKQYWGALNDSKSSPEMIEGFRAYYFQTSKDLKKAFELLGASHV